MARKLTMASLAEEQYAVKYLEVQDLVTQIMGLTEDLPAPSETFQPHWGHVGDMTETARRLAAVVAFLNHTEV